MSLQLSRRRMLGQSAKLFAALPISGLPLAQLAFAQNAPKLKVVFAVIPDGFGVDPYGGFSNGLWYPNLSGPVTEQFEQTELIQYLGEYKNQALFLKGLLLGSGTGGHNGWQTVLRDTNSSSTSIDVILGQSMQGTNAAIKRLYSGPHARIDVNWNISYQGATMILPEDNPYKLFDSVYGNYQGSSTSSANVLADTSHVFDPVLDDINSLRTALGASEKNKLDMHLGAVEQVVTDLRNSLPTQSACDASLAEPSDGLGIHSADFRDEVTKAHSDIVASTLSCGISRVATLQIGRSADQVVLKGVSSTRNPHDCAHRYGSVDEWKNSRIWYVEQVKYLLDKLASFPDPDSAGDSLLDHTLVVFTSEMADGAPEHMQDLPITFIGGASGLVQHGNGNGRFLDVSSQGDRTHWKLGQCTDVQRVWSTLAKACGTSVPWSGDTSTLQGLFTNV